MVAVTTFFSCWYIASDCSTIAWSEVKDTQASSTINCWQLWRSLSTDEHLHNFNYHVTSLLFNGIASCHKKSYDYTLRNTWIAGAQQQEVMSFTEAISSFKIIKPCLKQPYDVSVICSFYKVHMKWSLMLDPLFPNFFIDCTFPYSPNLFL